MKMTCNVLLNLTAIPSAIIIIGLFLSWLETVPDSQEGFVLSLLLCVRFHRFFPTYSLAFPSSHGTGRDNDRISPLRFVSDISQKGLGDPRLQQKTQESCKHGVFRLYPAPLCG